MPRPLFSHPMVFKEEAAPGRSTWGWTASPPANPAALPAGAVAANTATLTAATAIYVNVRDIDGTDFTLLLSAVRGGGGAGQSDVLILANRKGVVRFKVTGMPITLSGGTVVQFPVALVGLTGVAPTVGDAMVVYIGFAATT